MDLAKPSRGRRKVVAVQMQERLVQALVSVGQFPFGESLVQETGAQRNEHLMDGNVGVETGRLQQQIAMSQTNRSQPRSSVFDRFVFNQFHAVVTNTPQEVQHEGFPRLIAPGGDRCAVELLENFGDHIDRWRVKSVAKVVQYPSLRILNHSVADHRFDLFSKTTQGVRLGDDPTEFRSGPRSQRKLQHRQSQGITGAETGNQPIGLITQIVNQHGDQIIDPNPALPQLVPITFFRKVCMATKELAPRFDSIVKAEMFERMQRVVVHKDSDRPLRRKKVSRMLDHMAQVCGRFVGSAVRLSRRVDSC